MKRLLIVALVLVIACTSTPQRGVIAMRSGPTSIHGQITTEGMTLPGDTVTVTDAKGTLRTAVSDADGRFAFNALSPGQYTVNATLAGMEVISRRVTVVSGSMTVVGIDMRPATISESITVTAAAPMINTQSSAVSASISPVFRKRRPAIRTARTPSLKPRSQLARNTPRLRTTVSWTQLHNA